LLAALGRWLTNDPLHYYAGDNNLYAYEGSTPTAGTDPLGFLFESSLEMVRHLDGMQYGETAMTFTVDAVCECALHLAYIPIELYLTKYLVTANAQVRTHYYDTWTVSPTGALVGVAEFPRRAFNILRSIAHELTHVSHAKRWHDRNSNSIKRDFSGTFPDKYKCLNRMKNMKIKWDREWHTFYMGEANHTNQGWEGLVLVTEHQNDPGWGFPIIWK